MAAVGSDARKNGCEDTGSDQLRKRQPGQITTSVPVIVYAKELGVSDEMRTAP